MSRKATQSLPKYEGGGENRIQGDAIVCPRVMDTRVSKYKVLRSERRASDEARGGEKVRETAAH